MIEIDYFVYIFLKLLKKPAENNKSNVERKIET